MRMSKITETVLALAKPVAETQGCEIWDVEYVRESGAWYLRVYLDKPGGVSIDDCEAISRALDPILDEADPIPTSYIFEVSSAGAERELKRPSDFERFTGETVEVKHYQPICGAKSHVGVLLGYDNGAVTIETGGKAVQYNKAQVAQVRLRMTQ
jgi:ribosome maturation factor RimP